MWINIKDLTFLVTIYTSVSNIVSIMPHGLNESHITSHTGEEITDQLVNNSLKFISHEGNISSCQRWQNTNPSHVQFMDKISGSFVVN